MSRKNRIWYPGAIYHVMSRGNRRVKIFDDRTDYLCFLKCIRKTKEEFPFKIHGLCLMTNHFHMAIETEIENVSIIMQKLLGRYAKSYNHRHSFCGHLFEHRYIAQVIEDERYFLEVSRYIHLNPVKAHIVDDPFDYEYSSYRWFVHDTPFSGGNKVAMLIEELVETARVLQSFGGDAREQYRIFVNGLDDHEDHELLIQKDMRDYE